MLSLFTFTRLFAQSGDGAVIPGDFADPSIIKVGKQYFAVGTSSEWAPHFPIYQSTDLKNWQQSGYVFNKTPDWANGSFWAPEYYKIGSTYYMYYTARRKSDNACYIGVATSTYPNKDFRDHGVVLAHGKEAIDAFIFRDKGKLYLTFKAYGLENRPVELLACELSADGLNVIGKPFTLLRDDARKGMEGQSIIKRGEYYYIFYSAGNCCGDGCSYEIGVARSKSFAGPYEYFSNNPILSENSVWKCMGHGTFVNASNEQTYYLHHAYNKATNVSTGRQALISKLNWSSDNGWPSFEAQAISNTKPIDIFDNFASTNLSKRWQWDFRNSTPFTQQDNGVLDLGGVTKVGNNAGIVLTTRPTSAVFSAQVTVVNSNDALKGISFYGDANAAIGIGVKNNNVMVWQVIDNKFSVLFQRAIDKNISSKLMLAVNEGRDVLFSIKQGNQSWQKLPVQIDLKKTNLAQWDRSPRIGLHYQGDNKMRARFSNFILKQN